MTDWDVFVNALLVKFGPSVDDPLESMTWLRQEGQQLKNSKISLKPYPIG